MYSLKETRAKVEQALVALSAIKETLQVEPAVEAAETTEAPTAPIASPLSGHMLDALRTLRNKHQAEQKTEAVHRRERQLAHIDHKVEALRKLSLSIVLAEQKRTELLEKYAPEMAKLAEAGAELIQGVETPRHPLAYSGIRLGNGLEIRNISGDMVFINGFRVACPFVTAGYGEDWVKPIHSFDPEKFVAMAATVPVPVAEPSVDTAEDEYVEEEDELDEDAVNELESEEA